MTTLLLALMISSNLLLSERNGLKRTNLVGAWFCLTDLTRALRPPQQGLKAVQSVSDVFLEILDDDDDEEGDQEEWARAD
jgi:hypothetical protein